VKPAAKLKGHFDEQVYTPPLSGYRPAVAGVLSQEKDCMVRADTSAPDNQTLWYTSRRGNGLTLCPSATGGWERWSLAEAGPTGRDRRWGARPDHSNAELPAPDPAKETLQLNEDTLWSGMPVTETTCRRRSFCLRCGAPYSKKGLHKADSSARRCRTFRRGVPGNRKPACGFDAHRALD